MDRITGSELHNLKELRPGSAGKTEIRILFIFDPQRQAVLLVAGDKSGNWARWYRDAVKLGRGPLRTLSGHPARGDPMTAHYRWETTLDERRRADPGIDDPARRARPARSAMLATSAAT